MEICASQAEKKLLRVIRYVARPVGAEFQDLPQNSPPKTLRICGWIKRFLINCSKVKPDRVGGSLTIEELGKRKEIKNFRPINFSLLCNSTMTALWNAGEELMGCTQYTYPTIICLRPNLFLATLHGGASLTMAKVPHWVPRLRSLTKKARKSCWVCKRF